VRAKQLLVFQAYRKTGLPRRFAPRNDAAGFVIEVNRGDFMEIPLPSPGISFSLPIRPCNCMSMDWQCDVPLIDLTF